MAFASTTHTAGFGLVDRVAATAQALRTRVEAYKVYRTTQGELSLLSNRELADLGLSRSMIKRIAIEAAYGK